LQGSAEALFRWGGKI